MTIRLLGVGSTVILCTSTLIGCSSSHSGSLPATHAGTLPVPSSRTASLTVRIAVPSRVQIASKRRTPRYISTSTSTLTFTINAVNGSVPNGGPVSTSVGLTPTSPGCSASGASVQCAVTIGAPVGSDSLTLTLADADGNALSTNTVTTTVVANTANTTSVTLDPILASLAFSPSGANCNAIFMCSRATSLTPLDAAGNTIVGPGSFVNAAGTLAPITLNPASSTLTLKTSGGAAAPTTLNAAADATMASVAYNGSGTAGSATVTAAATGTSSATYTLSLAPDPVLADSPAIYWKLDESGGTSVHDSSGNAADGTYDGTISLGQAALLTGDTGTAVGFNGTNTYVSSNSAYANPTTFSEEAWFKTSVPSGVLFGMSNLQNPFASSSYDRMIYFSSSGQLIFGWYSQVWGTRIISSVLSYSDGFRHHVVSTLSPTYAALYVDGSLTASTGVSAVQAPQPYTAYINVGANNSNVGWPEMGATPFTNGSIEKAAFYLTQLSAARILEHYNAGTGNY